MERVIVLGGGGHARVLIDLFRMCGDYEIAGILDPQFRKGTKIMSLPVLGGDELLKSSFDKGIKSACIGVGTTGDNRVRIRLCEMAKEIGYKIPFLIHPSAMVSKSVRLNDGVQVMAGAVIQVDSSIGSNSIINSGAIIEHDSIIGSNVHICPGAIINGGTVIGDNSFIGAGATIIHGIKIGRDAVIAAGAVVIHDLPDRIKVMGVPARRCNG
ncbi:MAG: acetyltransferase [Nitrospirota bacterium]